MMASAPGPTTDPTRALGGYEIDAQAAQGGAEPLDAAGPPRPHKAPAPAGLPVMDAARRRAGPMQLVGHPSPDGETPLSTPGFIAREACDVLMDSRSLRNELVAVHGGQSPYALST